MRHVFIARFLTAILFFNFILIPPSLAADELADKKKTQLCAKHEDCTYAETACGSKQAVNLLYHAALQEKFDKQGENTDCMWQDKRVVTASYCLAARCHIELKNPE